MRKDQRAFVLSLALASTVLASAATTTSAHELTAAEVTAASIDPIYLAFYKFDPTLEQPNIFMKI